MAIFNDLIVTGSSRFSGPVSLDSIANPDDADIMTLSTNQTAEGIKTFTNGIKVGSATVAYDSSAGAVVISF